MLQPLDNPRGWRVAGDVVICPACQRRSVFNRDLDRFFHTSGADNRVCWAYITSGQLVPRPVLGGDPGTDLGRRVA